MLISILLHYGFKTRLFTEMACNSTHRMILSGECLRVERNNLLRLPEMTGFVYQRYQNIGIK